MKKYIKYIVLLVILIVIFVLGFFIYKNMFADAVNSRYKDLENYNITPRKTYDLEFEFPFELIPNKYLWDFIRGFFDGDGQVSYSEETHQFTFALYGTSEKFMNQLGDIFEKEFGIENVAKLPINPEFAKLSDNGAIENFEGNYLDNILDTIINN